MANTSPVENVLTVPAAIALSSDKTTANAAKAQENYKSISELMVQMQADSKTIGNTIDTPETVLARNLGQLETEQQSQKLAVEAGFNPDMSIDIRAIMLRDIRDTGLKMRDATQRLQDQKAVSLFDDPIEAVVNAFVIPWTEQEISGYQEQQAAARKTLDDITSGVTNSATAQKAIQSSVTTESIRGQYDALQGMIRNKQRAIGIDVLQNNTESIKFSMQADHTQLENVLALNRWMNEERNYAMLKAQKDIMLSDHKLRLQERTDRIAADKEFLGYVNTALTKNNLPVIASVDEMNRRRQTAQGKALFDDLYDKGRVLTDPRFNAAYTDGDTVAERVKFWQVTNKPVTNPDEREFAKLNIDAYNKSQSKEAKNSKGELVTAEEYFNTKFNEKFGIIKKDDDTNPNRAQTFETMANRANLTTDQNFKRIFAAVVAPNISTANKSVAAHPDLVAPMVVKAVENKVISPNDAAVFLADFYTASANIASVSAKTFEWNKRNFTNFKTEVPVGVSAATAGVITGLTAASTLAIASGVGVPAGITGLVVAGGYGAMDAIRDRNMEIEWTDPNQVGNYIVRQVSAGIRTGSGMPDKILTKPQGAPVK